LPCRISFARLEEFVWDRGEWHVACNKVLATFEQQQTVLLRQKQGVCADSSNATLLPYYGGRDRRYSMWPCLRQRWPHIRSAAVNSGRILPFSFGPGTGSEVGPHPDNRSRLRQDSAFFFLSRIRTRSQKFGKNRTRSHFSIPVVARVFMVIS